MTAYGYGESREDELIFCCEMRSLNARFLEVNVRLPRYLLAFETDLIKATKSRLQRGKIDVFVDINSKNGQRELPVLDLDAVRHYSDLLTQITKQVDSSSRGTTPRPATAMDFLRLDGVLQQPERLRERGEVAVNLYKKGLFEAHTAAVDALRTEREREGDTLKGALTELLEELDRARRSIVDRRDDVTAQLTTQWQKRFDNLLANAAGSETKISEERLHMEMAMLMDKADIEEELTRLSTHIGEFQKLFAADTAIGRKMDFLCQEMHREVNTMSNKLMQTDISKHTLNMKQTIERIRQQVQNIE